MMGANMTTMDISHDKESIPSINHHEKKAIIDGLHAMNDALTKLDELYQDRTHIKESFDETIELFQRVKITQQVVGSDLKRCDDECSDIRMLKKCYYTVLKEHEVIKD